VNTLLAIDGGGTGTRVFLLYEDGRVIARGDSGPSNFHNAGEQEAVDHICQAVRRAFSSLGKSPSQVAGVFAGLAAMKSSADRARMTAALESRGLAVPGSLVVQSDVFNAHAGGFAGAPGIVVIAGTGSFCFGRDSLNQTSACGGWGWFLGDEGAAFGLGADALRRAVRAADGREAGSALLASALSFFQITDPDEIPARLYSGGNRTPAVAAFAEVVIQLAREGDAGALGVLEKGVQHLAELVAVVDSQLQFPEGAEVVLLGGCARSGAPYQPLLEQTIRYRCPGIRLVEPRGDSEFGACWNALRLAHPGLPVADLPDISRHY